MKKTSSDSGSRSTSNCISPRVTSLVIGCVDVMLGLVGLSLLLLDVRQRHGVLFPFIEKDQLAESPELLDEVGESYQFLLEFWLPSFFLFILGLTLITSAVTRNRCLVLFSFVLSTLFIAGCLATVVSLLISQKVGMMCFFTIFLITVSQIYFYVIVGTFWMELEAQHRPEDKEMLVIKNEI